MSDLSRIPTRTLLQNWVWGGDLSFNLVDAGKELKKRNINLSLLTDEVNDLIERFVK